MPAGRLDASGKFSRAFEEPDQSACADGDAVRFDSKSHGALEVVVRE